MTGFVIINVRMASSCSTQVHAINLQTQHSLDLLLKLLSLDSTHFFCDFPAPDSRKPLAKGLWSILSWVTFSFW